MGVVIDNFNKIKDKLGGYALLAEAWKEWVQTQLILQNFKPKNNSDQKDLFEELKSTL